MTPEEKDVLFDIVERIKNPKELINLNDFKKEKLYDFNHGKGASIKLLDKYYLDIISTESFSEDEYSRLDKIIGQLDRDWIFVNDISEFDWDKVVYDGMGYVILDDGTRVDIGSDTFKTQREAYNKYKSERNRRKRS